MLCLLAMLLFVQSLTAMVSSDNPACNKTRTSKAEGFAQKSTTCGLKLTDARGKIYYDVASSQQQRYCEYLIDSGKSDVTINITKFLLSETSCMAEYVTIECMNENCSVLPPPYCKSGGPSPILLRYCSQVRIVLIRQDLSRAYPCGQFEIEYSIGRNYHDSVTVFDAKPVVYKNQVDNTVIEPAAQKVKKPMKKVKKMIHLSASLLDNINWFLGLHRRALSSCEEISRKARDTMAVKADVLTRPGVGERVERADGNAMKWTPLLIWTTLMTQLLGDMSREMF